jgi:PAS domain S-box-containing protein
MNTPVLKILILEDSDTDAEMIKRILQKSELNCEFRVMMTKAALEASLTEFMPDVILSDNAMPQFSASEALELIKEHKLYIPFILVTGTVSEEFAASIIKAGADDYLLKDRLTRLPAAIEAALKQKQTETEKIASAKKLEQSEKRFRSLVENNEGIIALMDKDLKAIYRSSSAARLTGWSNDEYAKVDIKEYVHPGDVEKLQLVMKESLENPGQPVSHSLRIKHKNGQYIWLEGVLTNMLNDADVGGFIINMRDVTDKVEAEQKIIKANRLYFFISQINQMIVRTTDEKTLFAEVCQIAVEVGKFRMAWIGIIDEQTKKLIPVMHAGEERGYLSAIEEFSIENVPGSCGPSGTSLQEKEYIICNDIENHTNAASWKEAALDRGYCSSMSLPVKKFGKVVGSFSVYASEKDFFDAEEIALLEEATGDVSFALEVFEKENLRKKAEDAVVKSEQRYHTLTDVSPVGIFHTDASGSTTYVNPRWCEISGLPFEEGLDYGWLKAVYEEDKIELIKGWEKATEIKELSTSEYRFVRPDGAVIWVLGQATPERNAGGEVVGYVGTVTDITEQKNAEERIIKSEKRFRKLVENADDAFAILNTEGQALYVSSSVERVLGYSEAEIARLDLFTLTHPDDREEVAKTFQRCIDNPGITIPGYTSRLLHKDGSYHWFEDTIINLIDDPDIGGIVDNFRDVTERVNNQNALAQSEEKHRDIVENITDILCTHDLEGNILSVNATAKKALGYEVEDLLRMRIQDLLQDGTKDRFINYIERVKKSGFAQGLMYVQNSKAEKRVWEFKNTLRVVEGKPSFVYGFARDVTERIDAEEAIKTANERFEFLAKATNDIIWDWNLNTQEVWWNDNYYRLFGFNPDIPAGINTWKDIIHENDRERVANGIHKAIEDGESFWEDEYRCISKDGKEMFIYDRGFVLFDEAGKPCRMLGSMLDFTERKIAEEETKSSEEKRRLIMNAALDAIICIDTAGLITFWNPQAQQIFGWHENEVMGKMLSEIIIPQPYRAMHDQGIKNYIRTGEGPVLNKLLHLNAINRQQEEFPVELTVLPIKQGGEEFFCAFIRDITERKKAEEAIKESEEKYRTLVEQASDGIFIADNTGKFIMVNSSGSNMSGYTTEELKNLTIYNLVNPQSLVTNPFKFEEMHQPQGGRSERKMVRKDGVEIDVEISAKFLSDKRFIAFIRNISERIKAQEALMASEEKYRSLVEQASDAIFIADTDGRFITVNSSACKLSGHTEAKLLQMTIFDFAVKADIEKQAFRFDELRQGKTTVTERLMKGQAGNSVHVEITSKLLSNGRLLSFVRDISERIKAQNEIIKEKNLSDSIINSLPASFFMINNEGKMLRWNKHLENASKYSSEEVANMHPFDFFIPAHKPMLMEKITNVFLSGEDSMEATVELKTKERVPYYFKGIAIEYDGMSCIMGVGIDISERVKAQEEIKLTNEKLRELTTHLLNVREEERKRIGREIHDELGQQLTAIKMDVSWIDKKLAADTTLVKNKLKNIITLLDGSNQSIRRILSELRPGILDDNGLVEALEWLNRKFTSQTGIPVEFKADEMELKLPEPVSTCIFRVYQETFTNITRYAGAGKVRASLIIKKGTICVTVEDDGIGFDITEAQNKKSFGILGMKERILALSGSFQLISQPGKGTKIIIVLPIVI